MSGCNYTRPCPDCGAEMECYVDWKPYDTNNCTCLDCGFTAWMKKARLTLEEVNEERENYDLPKLEKLKEGGQYYVEPDKSARVAELTGLMTAYSITLQDIIDEYNKEKEGRLLEPCPTCNGTGKLREQDCPRCAKSGIIS